LIVATITGFGAGGPFESHVGVGPTVEATTGATWLMGYGDGRPQGTGSAYLDPISAWSTLCAVLSMLFGRQNDEAPGGAVELNLRENALQWMGEFLCDTAEGREVMSREPNANQAFALHGIFPAAKPDSWVAAHAEAISSFDGMPGGEDGSTGLVDWIRSQDAAIAAATLQERGVAAAPVQTGADLYRDPQLHEAGYVCDLDHPAAGRGRYALSPLRIGESVRPNGSSDVRPSPTLGRDTVALLRDLLGLPEDTIDALLRSGAASMAEGSNAGTSERRGDAG
jgi:crotonobetainyl-CoA:carnitine CoA-transferase CaiB-like acyl-CoA transferase